MNRSLRNYFIILLILIGVVAAYSLSFRTRIIDWEETYNPDDKIPYGTYILDNEIDTFFDKPVQRYGKTPYEFFTENDSLQLYNFIFIDEIQDDVSAKKIMNSVKNGSKALLMGSAFHSFDSLGIDSYYRFYEEGTSLELTTRSLKNKKFPLLNANGSDVKYFDKLDTKRDKVLGYVYCDGQKYINFIEVPYGKGTFYIHIEPKVVSNFYLKNTDFQEYTSSVLAYLPTKNRTVWFDWNFSENYQANPEQQRNFMSVIFENPALAAGWRIIFIGFVLYLIFQGKRKQRIVPVIEKLQNTTLVFTQTIGNLYFQEGDPRGIAQKKILYFLDNVRNKYYIETQYIDENFAHRLQQKSAQDKQLVNQIVELIRQFEKTKIADENFLIKLDKLIHQFWNKK